MSWEAYKNANLRGEAVKGELGSVKGELRSVKGALKSVKGELRLAGRLGT